MQDIVGCRVVVDTIIEQDALALRLAARFPDARLVDRRLQPSHGYRAVHYILQLQGKPYEVQIRTRLQHAWAQVVERLSDRVYPDLKYGKPEGMVPEFISGLSETIRNLEDVEHEVFSSRGAPDIATAKARMARLSNVRKSVLDMLDIIETEAKH